MNTYPLEAMSLDEAKKIQFELVDTVTRHFQGSEVLSLGDLGVINGLNKPKTTFKVEETLADFFGVEKAVLVRGAGTGALRYSIMSILKSNDNLLVHDAPLYPTTKITIQSMGTNVIKADFNNMENIQKVIEVNKIDAALIQYTRQKIDDKYNIKDVIQKIKSIKDIPIITDDNYAVMKVRKIGVQNGADLSTFSMFKLLGPEGIGCVLGKKEYIDKIIDFNYSGGSQVQGFEALEALRGLIYAPVQLAIQAQVCEELMQRLNAGEVKKVKRAFIANAQSRVVIVEFDENIAKDILKETNKLGAAPNPIGAESKYEFVPMIYRISGTFRESDPHLEDRMIRINPMRCGVDTIIRILKDAIKAIGY
ncbi:Cystathionine beta-lyase/cystathionine gamma-synthase [Caloramator quimbayensis]|uniref:Cystathionine beta-lyase/cystathionine gamma-synthase n=1 Tax=Caloramator quimbayensis TaxID=1147123 RepID=A0A1T4Y793_9CLOT|nr:aminotransferase class V-fold PLP-dependent enzyme [Caloramator quimbayensis]SKA97145.1 Cystathionine beta-lyase/cystathionine gamma-synthase [Caloramator quimbayensis]